MQIEFNKKFIKNMQKTWDYIALDSVNNVKLIIKNEKIAKAAQ